MGTLLARDAELAALEAALAEACGGRGRLFLLVGEPGIGKTRLADELCARAPADVRVLWGRCWEAGGAPAYWPWIEILRPLLGETDGAALARELGPWGGALAALLPELRQRVPEAAGGEAAPAADAEHARFLLYDAVARLLRAEAARAPLLLVLDDLHAADRPTLALLELVARTLRGTRALVVGTYRDADPLLSPEVAALLGRIERAGERLPLRRLRESEVAAFLQAASGAPADPRTVAAVSRATEGTPLFVAEVVRLVLAQGEAALPGTPIVPDGLQPAIRGNLARVSDTARAVLRVGAVAGRDFGFDLLRALAAAEADELAGVDLEAALGEAARAGLVAPLPEDPSRVTERRYRFAHILIRETLYRDLGAVERERLHGRVGEALEAAGAAAGPERLAELAHHFLRAPAGPNRRRGADYARRAGETALRAYAHEEAAGHFRRALDVLEEQRDAGTDRERVELLLALAEAHQRSGERPPAREAALQAAELARGLGDAAALAAAALRLGAEFIYGRVDPVLVALLEEALRGLPAGPSLLRARVMARLAAARQPAPDADAQTALAREAAAMARALGDPLTLSAVLRDARSAYLPMDSLEERTEVDVETAALARHAGDTHAGLHAEMRLFSDRLESGLLDEALGHLDAHDRLAGQRREPHRLWWSRYQRASLHVLRGQFDEAEHLLRLGDAAVEQTREPLAQLSRGGHWATFAVTSTRPVDLVALGREMQEAAAAHVPLTREYAFWELIFRCRAGQLEAVRAGLRQRAVRDVHPRFTGWHMLGEMARLADDRELAELTYERMCPWARRLTNTFFGSEGAYSLTLGRLADYLGRADEARVWFEMALDDHRRIGAEPWVAQGAVDYADLLLRAGGEGDARWARELLAEAHAIAERLGMPGLLERLRALGSAGEEAAAPAPLRGRPPEAALPADAFVLEGEYWTVRFDGAAYRFKDSKGMQILAHLVRHPGREFHAVQLAAVAEGADSGEGLVQGAAAALPDAEARAAYRARAEDLRDGLREAEANGDVGRAARLREELEALAEELARGVGLGGRQRKTGSSAERARVNVQRRLADALRKIDEACAPLGRLLARSVRTGAYCAYEP
jgi:hypothetical protein